MCKGMVMSWTPCRYVGYESGRTGKDNGVCGYVDDGGVNSSCNSYSFNSSSELYIVH